MTFNPDRSPPPPAASMIRAHPRSQGRHAFTLIEIAICLAVISFALLAVVGVLPRGMLTQRENRADTVIAQDGMYWMEALRSGTNGLDELTAFVDEVFVDPKTNRLGDGFDTGRDIIGLLSTPGTRVHAVVRALTGPAASRSTNELVQDTAFKYLMEVEIDRAAIPDPAAPEVSDVTLTFRWPVTRLGAGGRNRVFRGQIAQTNGLPTQLGVTAYGGNLYFFEP
jgi:prepilin-type N-terminal cleavage/methylation domain-containing protein